MYQKELINLTCDYIGPNYLGALKGFDLSELTPITIEKLIIEEIFIKQEPLGIDMYYSDEVLFNGNSTKLEIVIEYEKTKYELNHIIIADIFCNLMNYVNKLRSYEGYDSGLGSIDSGQIVDKIESKLRKKVGKKDKIKYLKKCFRKHFPDHDEWYLFYDVDNEYENKILENEISWYEYIYGYLEGEEGLAIIKRYLTYEGEFEEYNFDHIINEVLEGDSELDYCETKDLLLKWTYFYEKEIVLSSILWLIERVKNPNKPAFASEESTFGSYLEDMDEYDDFGDYYDDQIIDYSDIGFSASEIALFLYYKDYVNEKIINKEGISEGQYWDEISKIFKKSGANIRNKYGEFSGSKESRLLATHNKIKMFEKILPHLSENSQIKCREELNAIKLNL